MNTQELEFTRFVHEYKATIYTVCYMFSKDNDEVNDLFQDILIKLWKGFASFKGDSSAKTWIYRVALNACLDADRKKKRAGGCITGGLFIGEFVDKDIPWAHLDIGGTSTATKTEGFKVKGGTAFGTMTLIKLAGML